MKEMYDLLKSWRADAEVYRKRWPTELPGASQMTNKKMPELAKPWVVLYGDGGLWGRWATRSDAERGHEHAARNKADFSPFTVVRLAVVEVVEPEPKAAPSGWVYDELTEQLLAAGGEAITLLSDLVDLIDNTDALDTHADQWAELKERYYTVQSKWFDAPAPLEVTEK